MGPFYVTHHTLFFPLRILFKKQPDKDADEHENVDVEQSIHQIGQLRRHLKVSFLNSLIKQTAINKTM